MKNKFFQFFAVIISTFFLADQYAHSGTRIILEAENASDIQPPVVVIDAENPQNAKAAKGASGGKYIEIAQGVGKPAEGGLPGNATLNFRIEKGGDYYIWARCFWQDGCGNSFFMQIDEKPPFIFGQDSTYETWHWIKAPKLLTPVKLTKGEHKITIRNREDGIRIDQFVITDNSRYIPVDIEEP